MGIRMAHLREQGINFVVFDADAQSSSQSARASLLAQLTQRARANGLRVDKSALAFMEGRSLTYFGTPDLVRFLRNWRPHWTHELT